MLNNEDIDVYRQLAGGTTTALVLHGSANPIGGQSQIVKWKWGHPVSEWPIADAPRTIKFALGENPKSSNFRPPPGIPAQYPQTRMGVEEVIRQSFIDARDYTARWDEYEARKKRGENRSAAHDILMETMVDILKERSIVHSHCYRADEIMMLLNVSDEQGFKIRELQHVLGGLSLPKRSPRTAWAAARSSTGGDSRPRAVTPFRTTSRHDARRRVTSVNPIPPSWPRHLNRTRPRR